MAISNLIHHESGFRADVYLAGHDPLHSWALEKVRRIELDGGVTIPFAPPEYVIIRKLDYYRMGERQKHIRDIRAMLEIAFDQIDRTILAEKIEEMGLTGLWKKLGLGE